LTAHRQFGVLLSASLAGNGFNRFASKAENGFVEVMNCFTTVSCNRRHRRVNEKAARQALMRKPAPSAETRPSDRSSRAWRPLWPRMQCKRIPGSSHRRRDPRIALRSIRATTAGLGVGM